MGVVDRRFPAPGRLLALVVVTAAALLCMPGTAGAVLRVTVTGTELTVQTEGGEAAITCIGGKVKVNGDVDPGPPPNGIPATPTDCASITKIVVRHVATRTADLFDLRGVRSAEFGALSNGAPSVFLEPGEGLNTVFGSQLPDRIVGGISGERLIGEGGNDQISAGGGLDTMVWNPGDGVDAFDGGTSEDILEIEGDATSETFGVQSGAAGHVELRRQGVLIVDATEPERLDLNPGEGADTLTVAPGGPTDLSTLAIKADGGPGDDNLSGGPGKDVLLGNGGTDTLAAASGEDSLTGGPGTDTASGGDGNDKLIWNPGDGSDTMVGGADNDTVEVNGGGLGERFTAQPNGAQVKFDRLADLPAGITAFTLDIDTSEKLALNAAGGDDKFNEGAPIGNLNGVEVDADGGPGLDELNGTEGRDTLQGGEGADLLRGGAGSDPMSGGSGDDRLVGGPNTAASDSLRGGEGDDVFVVNDGDGFDQVDGDGNSDTVEVNGNTLSERFTAQQIGPEVRVERLADLATGVTALRVNIETTEKLALNAGPGNDVLNEAGPAAGLATSIEVDGGPGGDVLKAGAGPDTLRGGDGADALHGGGGADAISGELGNDGLTGGPGADVMSGGGDEDTFVWSNGDGSDTVEGDAGNDRVEVNGTAAPEQFTVVAGAQQGRISVGRIGTATPPVTAFTLDTGTVESLILNAGDGDDTVNAPGPSVGLNGLAITANGQEGQDQLNGGDGPDTLNGGLGDDTIGGGDGADGLSGGEGNDSLSGSNGDDVLNGEVHDDTLDGGSGFDVLHAGLGEDRLIGGPNPTGTVDNVFGGNGNDTIVWNSDDGNDLIEGGSGGDTVEVNGAGVDEEFTVAPGPVDGAITISRTAPDGAALDVRESERLELDAGDGNDTLNPAGPADLDDFLVLALGGPGADRLNGGSIRDFLIGGDGEDTLNAGDGEDFLDGGPGSDRLKGGPSPDGQFDHLVGGDGDDRFSWAPGDGHDFMEGEGGIDTAEVDGDGGGEQFVARANAGAVEIERNGLLALTLRDDEIFDLETGAGDDSLDSDGLAGLNTLSIVADGGLGADQLRGGEGDDLLMGGDGEDTLIWNAGDGSDSVDGGLDADVAKVNGGGAAEQFAIRANGGNEVVLEQAGVFALAITAENLDVNAGGGADTIDAGGTSLAARTSLDLDGGPGDDQITGGDGQDLLSGGSGADRLFSRDAVADTVNCGSEADTATADTKDAVAADCETIDNGVTKPPPGGGGGGGPAVSPDTKAPTITVAKRRLKVKKKKAVALTLGCPTDEKSCAVKVQLRLGAALVSSGAVTVGGGKSTTITLKLAAKARSALATKPKLRLKVATFATDAAGNQSRQSFPVTATT